MCQNALAVEKRVARALKGAATRAQKVASSTAPARLVPKRAISTSALLYKNSI
jgi:hypothetical protein